MPNVLSISKFKIRSRWQIFNFLITICSFSHIMWVSILQSIHLTVISSFLTAVTDYYHNNLVCSDIVCLPWTPPSLHLVSILLFILLVCTQWLGFLIIIYLLLPQLKEQPAARMSSERSTFIGKLEELSLSGLPLELVVVVGAVQWWRQQRWRG